MKNYMKMAASLFLAGATMFATGCKDDFAELNTDPSNVSEGDVSYFFSQAILDFEPSDYTYWFFNADDMYQWMQILVSTDGVDSRIYESNNAPGLQAINMLKMANAIAATRAEMDESESDRYAQYAACVDVLSVYMGIYDSDFIGNIPFTEAANFYYGGTLTPKYDSVSDLYTLWLTMLDEAVSTFTNPPVQQEFDAVQDPAYAGNAARWAKLANSLKLKIAARLISQDRARAISIVEDVANASCGVIDGTEDDFLFNKATYNSSNQDKTYHWNNGILQSVGASETMINFLVNNRDPRVRFIFEKNEWNSLIVQEFINRDRAGDIPSYIMANINLDAEGNFESWKAPGEPWVRYYGLPLEFNAGQQAGLYGDWFSYDINCRIDDDHTYVPFSLFNDEQVYGRLDFTLPVVPDGPVRQDQVDQPLYGMYMTTAEFKLFFAEFKLLGANLPLSAQDYFDKAVRASVAEYDRLASLNHIPYYETTYDYDPNEVSIELKDGEIDTMMEHDAFKLDGTPAQNLEKVYLQQIVHYLLSPVDVWVTCRRSGVPTFNSTLYPRMDYAANGLPVTEVPRRTTLSSPSPTDLMHDILMQSYEEQGYSIGSEGGILNSQRVWQDQGAPQYGAGPQI